jgi:hypothetical protein
MDQIDPLCNHTAGSSVDGVLICTDCGAIYDQEEYTWRYPEPA